MTISIDDAKHVAKLARLDLAPAELELYTSQLNNILDYAQSLQKINTENIEPTYSSIEAQRELRADEVKDFNNKEKIIENGPVTSGTSFVVPKIV